MAALGSGIRELKQTDAAAVNKQLSFQKDSRPREFIWPLQERITIIHSFKLNGDLNVTASSLPPRQFA